MRFVDDAKKAWKWFSMRCMVLAAALQGAWAGGGIPDELKHSVPENMIHWLTVALLVLGVIGRLVKQK